MPTLDRAQVRYVARLARLRLSEEEEERAAVELGKVLGYLERLAAVDVSSVEPLCFAGGDTEGVFREDVARPGLLREQALAAAPRQDGQAFVVPRIIE